MFKNHFVRAGSSLLALLLCSTGSLAEVSRSLPEAEQGSAWFLPTLTVNKQPICAELLRTETIKFLAPDEPSRDVDGLKEIFRGSEIPIDDPDVETFAEDPRQLALTLPDKSKAFIYFSRHPGCGGACESESVRISAEQMSAERRSQLRYQETSPTTTVGAVELRLYKAASGDFYVLGADDHHSPAYRATAGRWELSCDVALRPKMEGSDDPDIQAALQAIEALKMATGQVSRGGGYCGSLGTYWRWRHRRADGLEEALYRPWAVIESGDKYPSDNSHGDYARIEVQLQLWSAGGLVEYRAFAAYRTQLAQSTEALARFYTKKFGWPQPRATEMAAAAIKGVISSSFGFYLYEPFTAAEASLRHAILARRPVEELRAIEIDLASIDGDNEDSILNVAIEYPEALRYLLEQGVSPNTGNAFGKTPLMYAAQYNQIEAAQLLLAAGADPNAATVQPDDTCYYTLSSTGVTPLHYAARYASAPLIKLLVERGAVTFSEASVDHGIEYPIDRLRRYGGATAADERNPNINAAEFADILALFAVPSDAERQDIAADVVAQARADYAKGNAELAYRGLNIALAAQADNKNALADLPLIALRAGHTGMAVQASERATQVFKDPPSLAAAWFNRGLVCERTEARSLSYNGQRCEGDWVGPFVTALKLQPTTARANKLRALFTQGEGLCTPAGDQQGKTYRVFSDRRNNELHFYVFHRGPGALDPGSLQWSTSPYGSPVAIQPTVVEHLSLGSDAITLLISTGWSAEVLIDGHSCVVGH